MSSQEEQRKQKIPNGSQALEVAMHALGPVTVPSDSSVQLERQSYALRTAVYGSVRTVVWEDGAHAPPTR